MAQQITTSVENNFTKGLITESTGLAFPENAATDTDNCVYTIVGDVLRREGIDFEANRTFTTIDRTGKAMSSYKWNNVGGDGSVQIIVQQIGGTLYFFKSSAATTTSPLSAQRIASTITLSSALPAGSTNNPSILECQYSDGNGLLFVTHPYLEPFFVSYNGTSVASSVITISIRDFDGIAEPGVPTSQRPNSTSPGLSVQHRYNLLNQGWTDGQYGDVLTTANIATFANTTLINYAGAATGTLYGFFPSNSDVWFSFKDPRGTFNPCLDNLTKNTISSTPAPKGHFVLPAFNQDRNAALNTGGFTPITTLPVLTSNNQRPSSTSFYTGRIFYTGINHPSYAETIYFSQIIDITADPVSQFGACYQQNDPTAETLFDLLPTDGGTIKIQGSGFIYKLFPIQNGMLVFAANGIWFITGSQGIGFSASDYTITKISGIQSISSTSYVNVMGYPLFWNEEGLYTVAPGQTGGLTVTNLCLGTILTFFEGIPLQSKKFARGDYHAVDFIIQWVYRSTNESTITDRYQYDKILCYNVANKAFYTYTLPTGNVYIHDVKYVSGPGGSTSPDPTFKYIASRLNVNYTFSFAQEFDKTHYTDWFSVDNVGIDYTSFFITGYKLRGKAITKWQPAYIYMFSRNDFNTSYKIQGLWEFSLSGNSGRWSTIQVVNNNVSIKNFGIVTRRHKLRGHGLSLQIKVTSVNGKPFDIIGWTMFEEVNQGV